MGHRACNYSVGESSGKASKGFAKYTAGPAGMSQAQEGASSAVSEISRAKMVSFVDKTQQKIASVMF